MKKSRKKESSKILFDVGYDLYGDYVRKYRNQFSGLEILLKKAGIKYTLEEYLSFTILLCLIDFIILFPIITFITSLFLPLINAIIFSLMIVLGMVIFIFFISIAYPATLVKDRARKIESGLHYSLAYMASIATSGAPPIILFKTIAKMKDFPELSAEMRKIIRDVEIFGMDLLSAIKKEAERTPSTRLKEILLGIETVIRGGGDLYTYLNDKARDAVLEYERKVKSFSDTLSTLTEIYIIIVLLGPIFFAIMSSVMQSIGNAGYLLFLQTILIFIFIPMISVMLGYIIRIISP